MIKNMEIPGVAWSLKVTAIGGKPGIKKKKSKQPKFKALIMLQIIIRTFVAES